MKPAALVCALIAVYGISAQTITSADKTTVSRQLKDAEKYDVFQMKNDKGEAGWVFAKAPGISKLGSEYKLTTAPPKPTAEGAKTIDQLEKMDVQVGKSNGKPVFVEVYAPPGAKPDEIGAFTEKIGETKLAQWLKETGADVQKCAGSKQCVQTCGQPERCCRWECK